MYVLLQNGSKILKQSGDGFIRLSAVLSGVAKYVLLQTGSKIIKESEDGFLIYSTFSEESPQVFFGGYGPPTFKKYKKKLKKIKKAAVSKQTIDLANKIEIDLELLKKEYSDKIDAELIKAIKKLDFVVKSEIMREQEEEAILLVAGVI